MLKLSSFKTIAIVIIVCMVITITTTVKAAKSGIEIEYRSFSGVPTIGLPIDQYVANLAELSQQVLGQKMQLNFQKISPRPKIIQNDKYLNKINYTFNLAFSLFPSTFPQSQPGN